LSNTKKAEYYQQVQNLIFKIKQAEEQGDDASELYYRLEQILNSYLEEKYKDSPLLRRSHIS
jgi:hypothetical protein